MECTRQTGQSKQASSKDQNKYTILTEARKNTKISEKDNKQKIYKLQNSLFIFPLLDCKKYFQDLSSQHIFFCQINLIIIYLVEITYYFEFLMIKLISYFV